MKIKVKLDKGAFAPESAHEADAGYDLCTPTDCYIPEGGFGIIDTGVHIQIPEGYVGFLKSKNSLIMVIYCDRECKLCLFLTDYVLIKKCLDLLGAGKCFKGESIVRFPRFLLCRLGILVDDILTSANTFIADANTVESRDQEGDFGFVSAAEGTAVELFV